MGFVLQQEQGLAKCLVDAGIDPQKLRLHITEIAPGTRAHAPHTHTGVEAFYILEGHGTLDVEGEVATLGPNEALVLDATKLHGLANTGDTPLRYIVIIGQ